MIKIFYKTVSKQFLFQYLCYHVIAYVWHVCLQEKEQMVTGKEYSSGSSGLPQSILVVNDTTQVTTLQVLVVW